MRYLFVIIDGATDEPSEALDDRTPLEVARTPRLDALAQAGRVGMARFAPLEVGGDDWAWLTGVLGEDPRVVPLPGGAIRAHAWGLGPVPGVPLCLDLLGEGESDQTQGIAQWCHAISQAETRALVEAVMSRLRASLLDPCGAWTVSHVRAGAALLLDQSGETWDRVTCPGPSAVIGRAWADLGPTGRRAPAQVLARCMREARAVLGVHEVNAARREQGLRRATLAWVWGGGPAPAPRTPDRRRVFLSESDDACAVASLLGWTSEPVAPGALADRTRDAAGHDEVVCVHDASAARATRDVRDKVDALERLDADLLAPALDALAERAGDDWRVLVTPGRRVEASTGRVLDAHVPFVVSGAWIRGVVPRRLTEADAAEGDLQVDPGHTLLEFVLKSGLTGRRR
ncbi:MAG: hypothetical protein SFY69_10670 [Planctomycetota bacterium]|nr:hypothetical protein [Planctomycetota bacterium]